jgi:dihydrolipoamide dehydrogenase
LRVEAGGEAATVDGLLLCMGMTPNLDGLGLDRFDIDLDDRGMPPYDPLTGRVGDLPIYLAGDVSGDRPMLHEALDEGFIAGFNAVSDTDVCAERRVPLQICFSDPQAVVVGKSRTELDGSDVAVGAVDFADASRAVLEHRAAGCLRVYADPGTGRILGCEMAAPDAEHLGHLVALALQQKMTVNDLLKIPFYHPTITEALRSALRDAANLCRVRVELAGLELSECRPEKPLG